MLIVSALIGIFAFWLAYTFNQLVRMHNRVKEAWSNIDVQLKRRHDVLPKLIDVVKGYQQHEQQTQVNIAQLRSQLGSENFPAISAGENAVSSQLRGLLALSEAYPELKANQNFLQLQDSVSQLEDTLQKARRYYNGVVRDNNVLVQSIPGRWVAERMGFKTLPYFELQLISERESPAVEL
jgi:LemA protein